MVPATACESIENLFAAQTVRFETLDPVEDEMMIKRTLVSLCLLLTAIFVSACATTGAREQAMTGDVAHERHATGIDSQVSDN